MSSEESFVTAQRHYSRAFARLAEMRNRSELCDVTIIVDGEEIRAHRAILASCSRYFHAMFTSNMAECGQDRVRLKELDASSVLQVVRFAYSAEIEVTEKNVQQLLPAASLLQVEDVVAVCCEFLAGQLEPSNCLGIKSFSETHGCHNLVEQAKQFAVHHFNDVRHTDEFYILSAQELIELISRDDVCISTEKDVYDAVLEWISYDADNREPLAVSVLEHVRLPLLSRHCLVNEVAANPIVKASGQHLLVEALSYQLMPEDRWKVSGPRARPREPAGLSERMFAVGGGSLFAIHGTCESFNPSSNTWSIVAGMNTRRARLGVASVDPLVFVAGGWDGSSDLVLVEAYNPLDNTWVYVHPMGTRRSCLGLSALHRLIFAVGGFDGSSCLNSSECYDPLTDQWIAVSAMNVRRRYVRTCVCDDVLYACGGFDGTAHLATIEAFDPRHGKWIHKPSMMTKRSSCSVTALNGCLYAIGGHDGTAILNTVERYDMRNETWSVVAPMIIRRSTQDCVSLDGKLYVAGGNDGSSSLSSVETYKYQSNEWVLVTAMNVRRSSVGLTVLRCSTL
jgi:kelch-like protein 17 (actinfilin)